MTNKLITRIGLAVVLLAGVLSITGCTTTGNGTGGTSPVTSSLFSVNTNSGLLSVAGLEIPPDKVGGGIKIGVNLIVSPIIASDSNACPYFASAGAVLSIAADSGTYDPLALSNSLSHISVNALKNSSAARSAINGVLQLCDLYLAPLSKSGLDKLSPYIAPILGGAGGGMTAAAGNCSGP